MDKYEFSMKLDELKRLAANGQFRKAGKVLETIDLKKIKNIKELYVAIDILIENEKYEQAKEQLISISKKLKSRRVFHQLVDVSIKAKEVDSAKKYMKEFYKLAPKDSYNYVFRYQLAVLMQEGYEKQVEILEDLKQYEYLEKWAYELAKVYHRAGRDEDCVAECEDLILWFGDGVYVEKAKALKKYLTEATLPEEIQKAGKKNHLPNPGETREDSLEYFRANSEEKVPATEQEEESIPQRSYQPSYQSAFDFIEDMEMREKEEELDRMIEALDKKKVQNLVSQSMQDVLIQEEPGKENINESHMETTEMMDEYSEALTQPIREESGHADQEELQEEVQEEQPFEEQVPATEQEVKRLVEDTTDLIASQLSELFFQEEHQEENASEPENIPVWEAVSESDVITGPESVTETEALAGMEPVSESEEVVVPESMEEAETIPDPEVMEGAEAIADPEVIEEPDVIPEPEEVLECDPSLESGILPVSESSKDEQHLKTKSDVLEDVDQLIKKRKQRAIAKQLNSLVQKRVDDTSEAKDYLGQFAKMYTVGEEILRSLESLMEEHNNSTVILVDGQTTFCQTYFSRKLAKLLYAMKLIETQKFVLLNYEKFIRVDFEKHMDQIQGGCIVIEETQEITENMQKQLSLLMNHQCMILLELASGQEEEVCQNSLEEIQLENQSLVKVSAIHLKSFEEEDLVGFAADFLTEKEYSIDFEAEEYLKKYARKLSNQKDPDAFCKVLEKITKAYHCANQRNKVELRNIAELGNYQDAAFMSIKCTDFADEN